ncbi:MAG TPA: hypothetical protein VKA83_09200 [Methylomirabilota bacterium]|nr:hypothetical protein [Methylomirabilota bacterium]
MSILALDPATSTGWAIARPTFPGSVEYRMLESGVQTFALSRGDSPGMRYLRFRRWLEDVTPGDCTLIVYEQNFRRGGAATEVAANLAGRIQELCAIRAIEHTSVNVTTLKIWTCGSKKAASKEAMKAAVCNRWKVVESDDEADAVALLHYAIAELVPSGR